VEDDYSGGLYAAGVFASQNYDNANEYIALAGADTCYLWRDGLSPVTKTYPTSPNETIESTDTVSVVQAFDRLYILREAAQTISGTGWGLQRMRQSGALSFGRIDGIDVVTTTATVSVTAAHGYPAGSHSADRGIDHGQPSTRAMSSDIVDAAPAPTTFTLPLTVPIGTVDACGGWDQGSPGEASDILGWRQRPIPAGGCGCSG
jgi:hypothetical protein